MNFAQREVFRLHVSFIYRGYVVLYNSHEYLACMPSFIVINSKDEISHDEGLFIKNLFTFATATVDCDEQFFHLTFHFECLLCTCKWK